MKRELDGSLLSTVFVDYDNIYLSLRRKSEEAAKRFAKDAGTWLSAIASGSLITPTNGLPLSMPRRIVMQRSYGSTAPRRNDRDNSTDMQSFPFVRHHFVRAGFELIECPPLTGQGKNSADIRMVMDLRDYLLHDTYFDEFIILSSDSDFTPVLHRLRQHARRTVIYANDTTAVAYRAISDGEVREADLLALLMANDAPQALEAPAPRVEKGLPSPEMLGDARKEILTEVLGAVRQASQPVPLEALADRAVRVLGHDKTVGTAWGGVGSFRDLLARSLPSDMRLSDAAPYYVYDLTRQLSTPRAESEPARGEAIAAPARALAAARPPLAEPDAVETAARAVAQKADPAPREPAPASLRSEPAPLRERTPEPTNPPPQQSQPLQHREARASRPSVPAAPALPASAQAAVQSPMAQPALAQPPAAQSMRVADSTLTLQQSISRIYDACQAPPLSPPEYLALFDIMAGEINANGLSGARTLINICDRARDLGIETRKDDVRFILEVVSEADPWFEQGASGTLFATRFRNFVIARCKSQGLQLSADEIDLIDTWFTGAPQRGRLATQAALPAKAPSTAAPFHDMTAQQSAATGDWWQQHAPSSSQPQHYAQAPAGYAEPAPAGDPEDEFPRIIRSRLRG
ncbi:MAG: NYN domain-containing protein [Hyphomicrobiaceae bacterium]|nr:NYN domain-containing protein [Hyphomicrobiaceae bacterium]